MAAGDEGHRTYLYHKFDNSNREDVYRNALCDACKPHTSIRTFSVEEQISLGPQASVTHPQ